MISETYQTELELFEAERMLEAKLAANQASQEANDEQDREQDKAMLARIQDEFLKDPAVARLAERDRASSRIISITTRVVTANQRPCEASGREAIAKIGAKYTRTCGQVNTKRSASDCVSRPEPCIHPRVSKS